MPIVFSAVASNRNLVSNFASCDGNFMEIAEQVLTKLPSCNKKMTYSHGIYLLHYIAQDDHLYFCITDKLCQRSRAFLFLNEIQRRFTTSKRTDDFTTTLAAEMYRYSEDYSTIVIRKGELDELNSIRVGCSESLLGEKILYINNPDVISYSTISHVTATPGMISVSGVHSSQEELLLSVASPTSEGISVMTPTTYRQTDIGNSTLQNTTAGRKSPNNYIPETIPISQFSEDIQPDTTPEDSTSPNVDRISAVPPNQARLSTLSIVTKRLPVMSPRLYIVIVGMIILVIAMSVCALGPVSCVVVTGIGMYSLLRFYLGTKDKAD